MLIGRVLSVQIYFITYLENLTRAQSRDKSKGFKGYFSAIKRNKVLSFEITWMGIMLNEMGHRKTITI